jgi:hypothetical protein
MLGSCPDPKWEPFLILPDPIQPCRFPQWLFVSLYRTIPAVCIVPYRADAPPGKDILQPLMHQMKDLLIFWAQGEPIQLPPNLHPRNPNFSHMLIDANEQNLSMFAEALDYNPACGEEAAVGTTLREGA